jgi:hypothetical protein
MWIEVKMSSDDALGNEDRVFEVVTVPGHERDEHVTAEGEFAKLRRGAVGDDVAGADLVVHFDEGFLQDAGVLVRALEFRQLVDVDTGSPSEKDSVA